MIEPMRWPVVGRISFPPLFEKMLQFHNFARFGKTSCGIQRLPIPEMDFVNVLASSFKNVLESLFSLAALEFSIFVIIFKTFSSEVLIK